MKYCRKCGTQMPDDSKFCTKCGSQLSEESVRQPVKGKKPMLVGGGAILAVVVVALVIVLGRGKGSDNSDIAASFQNVSEKAEGQSGSDPGAVGQETMTQSQTAADDNDSEGGAGDGSENGSTTQLPKGAGQEGEESQETSAQFYLDRGYYIVQPGDKLELICRKIYNTTAMMDKLCDANQIEDTDQIYDGQRLVLP